jgi:hypothetical protein
MTRIDATATPLPSIPLPILDKLLPGQRLHIVMPKVGRVFHGLYSWGWQAHQRVPIKKVAEDPIKKDYPQLQSVSESRPMTLARHAKR